MSKQMSTNDVMEVLTPAIESIYMGIAQSKELTEVLESGTHITISNEGGITTPKGFFIIMGVKKEDPNPLDISPIINEYCDKQCRKILDQFKVQDNG